MYNTFKIHQMGLLSYSSTNKRPGACQAGQEVEPLLLGNILWAATARMDCQACILRRSLSDNSSGDFFLERNGRKNTKRGIKQLRL